MEKKKNLTGRQRLFAKLRLQRVFPQTTNKRVVRVLRGIDSALEVVERSLGEGMHGGALERPQEKPLVSTRVALGVTLKKEWAAVNVLMMVWAAGVCRP